MHTRNVGGERTDRPQNPSTGWALSVPDDKAFLNGRTKADLSFVATDQGLHHVRQRLLAHRIHRHFQDLNSLGNCNHWCACEAMSMPAENSFVINANASVRVLRRVVEAKRPVHSMRNRFAPVATGARMPPQTRSGQLSCCASASGASAPWPVRGAAPKACRRSGHTQRRRRTCRSQNGQWASASCRPDTRCTHRAGARGRP